MVSRDYHLFSKNASRVLSSGSRGKCVHARGIMWARGTVRTMDAQQDGLASFVKRRTLRSTTFSKIRNYSLAFKSVKENYNGCVCGRSGNDCNYLALLDSK